MDSGFICTHINLQRTLKYNKSFGKSHKAVQDKHSLSGVELLNSRQRSDCYAQFWGTHVLSTPTQNVPKMSYA